MRNSLLLVLSAMVLLMCCCCATGTDITKKNKDGSPIWTKEVPVSNVYLYGVGSANLSVDSQSQRAADAYARSDLALKISVNIKDATALYSNEASTVVLSAYETILIQSVNLTMRNVVVEQHWTADDGTVWSLVSIRIKDLPDLYADAANDYLYQLEEKKIATQQRLVSKLDELADLTENDAVEARKKLQEMAESEFSEIKDITDSIDVDALASQIAVFLAENGFELNE